MISLFSAIHDARLWRQPGPIHSDRLVIRSDRGATSSRVVLTAGYSLIEAIGSMVGHRPDGSRGSASITFLGGQFAPCVFCLAGPDPTGRTVATYTPMVTLSDAIVIGGAATYGISVNGKPLVHCHAWFSDESGKLFGGHLDPSKTIVGKRDLNVRVSDLGDLNLQQMPDTETNHSVFMPVVCKGHRQ